MDDDVRIIIWQTYGETVIHPVSLGFTLLMGMLMFTLPRRLAIVPAIITACFITDMQRIVLAGFDFNMLRILLVVGWTRLIVRGEIRSIELNPIDKAIILFVFSRMTIFTIRSGTFEALTYQLGEAFDAFGMYFLCRFLILDFADIKMIFKAIAMICIPLALSMLLEHATGRNMFSVFGGVAEFSVVREGRLRAQGAFSHPIMAGTFGATIVPFFYGLLKHPHGHLGIALAGLLAATVIVWTCASSGPILAYFFGVIGLLALLLKRHMSLIRWGILCSVVALHIYMKDPVWALVYRLNVVGGSTGYHRYVLIDAAIRNFKEWWLMGTATTAYWGYGLQDVTSQYILVGIDGGLFTLIFFIIIIVRCFRELGRARLAIQDRWETQAFLWPLGASLFATLLSFLSVSYFGQMIQIWYLQLALITAACTTACHVQNVTVQK
jgi:hypothetical protein